MTFRQAGTRLVTFQQAGTRLAALGLCAHALLAPVSIAGMQIALGVAAAGLLLARERPARTPLDWPAAAFVLVAIASDLLSPHGPPTLGYATLWRAFAGFWVAFQVLRLHPGTARPALLCAALGVSAAALVGLVQYRTGIDVVHALGLRAQPAFVLAPGVEGRYGAMGFFISRLTFSHNVLVFVALFAGALLAGAVRGRAALLVAVALALGTAALVLTFARGAWLGLGASALVLAVTLGARRTAQRGPVLGAVAAVVVLAVAIPGVRTRLFSAFDPAQNPDRLFLWTRATEIIRDHPLTGIGFGNYPRVCGAYYDRVDPTFPMRTWAHNSVLSVLAEMGPLGVLAALWMLVAAVRALLRSRSLLAPGALAALAGLLVAAQVHDVLYDTKVMYPLWLALALGLANPAEPADISSEPRSAT